MAEFFLKSQTKADRIFSSCVLEAAARKPGNVHPWAPFGDVAFEDFATAARAISPILAQAPALRIGRAICEAVTATRNATRSNPNLGIILLLAPLAAIPDESTCQAGIGDVLGSVTQEETALVYQAIRQARPGGLGTVTEHDVSAPPRISLIEAMRLAAKRDLVARQFANGFQEILQTGRSIFLDHSSKMDDWELSIVATHLELMSRYPDSLIARKCDQEVAEESARRAGLVLESGWPATSTGKQAFDDLDHWLRADGNRRNPGTSADLVAAILYAVMHDGLWRPPVVITIADNLE